MIAALLFACAMAAQEAPKTDVQPVPPQPQPVVLPAFSELPKVASTYRLAVTPALDGKLDPEEWEPLSPGTYLQWEPGTLYWAAEAKTGEDVVLSLDWNADGWLVGNDNLEIRASLKAGKVEFKSRRLDATNASGPKWVDPQIPVESLSGSAQQTATGWALEARYTPLLGASPESGHKFAARIDTCSEAAELEPAYLPRTLSPLLLQLDQGDNVPAGVSWHADWLVRSIAAGDKFKVRYEFQRNGPQEFKNVEFKVEGAAADYVASGTQPFPSFNRKNKASVDYESLVGPKSPIGYHVLRAVLNSADGSKSVLRSSFRTSELVDFDVNLPTDLTTMADARVIKGNVYIRSQAMGKLQGSYKLGVPAEWTIVRGGEERVVIYNSRGSRRIGIELIAPRGAKGVYPFTMKMEIGGKVVERTYYLQIR